MFVQLRFELQRLWRSKGILLIFMIAILLAWVNIEYQKSNSTIHSRDYQLIEHVSELPTLLYKNYSSEISRENFEETAGRIRWRNYLESENTEGTVTSGYRLSEQFFIELQEAIAQDGVSLSPEEERHLMYAQSVYHYIDQHKRDNPHYSYRGASTYLVDGNAILYGLLPLLLIGGLIIRLEAESFESKTSVLDRSLPIKRWHVLIARWLAGFTLGMIYIACVTVATMLRAFLMGEGLGDWFIPIYSVDTSSSPILLIQLWSGVLGLFLLKLSLLMSLALLIATTIRQVISAVVGWTYVQLFCFALTYILTAIQRNWNPFYFNYRQQIIGKFDYGIVEGESRYFLQMVDVRITLPILVAWFYVMCCCLVLAIVIHQWNHVAASYSTNKMSTIPQFKQPMFSAKVEFYKLNHFLPAKLVWSSILLTFIMLMSLITMKDYQSYQEVYQPEYLEMYQMLLPRLEEDIAYMESYQQENQNNVEEAHIFDLTLDYMIEQSTYYQQQLVIAEERKQAFVRQDGRAYYDSFEEDIISHYGLFSDAMESYKQKSGYYYDYYMNGKYPTTYGASVSTARLEQMKERGIRPIPNSHIVMTPYDKPAQIGDYFQEASAHQSADYTFLGIWHRLVTVYRLDLLLLVCFVLFCGAGYSVDTHQNQGLSWMYTLPRKRTDYLKDKYVASLWKAMLITVSLLAIVGITGLASAGFGQGEVPLIVYDQVVANPNDMTTFADSYHWTALSTVVFQSLLYVVAVACFVNALSICLSTFVRSHLFICSLSLMICGVGYIGLSYAAVPWVTSLLPFVYLDVASVLDNQVIFSFDVVRDSHHYGWIVLLVWAFICYRIARYRVQRYLI